MKVIICIGSSCHLKGSRQVVEKLQALVKENHLEDKVELGGTFCMGDCVNGRQRHLDGEKHSVSPDTTEEFFPERDSRKGSVSIRNKNLAGARAFLHRLSVRKLLCAAKRSRK